MSKPRVRTRVRRTIPKTAYGLQAHTWHDPCTCVRRHETSSHFGKVATSPEKQLIPITQAATWIWKQNYRHLDHIVADLLRQPRPSPSMISEEPKLTKDYDDKLLGRPCPACTLSSAGPRASMSAGSSSSPKSPRGSRSNTFSLPLRASSISRALWIYCASFEVSAGS